MDYENLIRQLIDLDKNPEEEFEIIEPLGNGSYGCVFKALNRSNKKVLAVKLIPLN